MKKPVLVLLFALAVMAPCFAKGPRLSSGFYAGPGFFFSNSETSLIGITSVTETRYTQASFGAFLDTRYALVSLGYWMFDGQAAVTSTIGSTSIRSNPDFYTNHISIGVAAKYPFTLSKGLEAWPLFGLMGTINTGRTGKDSMSEEAQRDLNDLWLQVGTGLDWSISKDFYLRLFAGSLFSLTARPTGSLSSAKYSSLVLDTSLALGYRF